MFKLKFLSFVIFVVIVGVAVGLQKTADDEQITTFEECLEAGYPAMESYPRQCRTLAGDLFIEEIEGAIPLEGERCEEHAVDVCPIELQCAVCPPCPECSSISCQNKEICLEMGFDEDWHEEMQKAQAGQDDEIGVTN